MTKIAICISHPNEYYHSEFVHSFMSLQKPVDTSTMVLGTRPIDMARNQLAAQALADPKVTHLLWLSSDLSFRHMADAISRLLAHNKPFVSALYFDKVFPFAPLAFKAKKDGTYSGITDYPEGTFDADAVSLGFSLIQRDVFEKLKAPYFQLDAKTGSGDDLYFCKKVRDAKFEIVVDGTLKPYHLRTEGFGEGHFKTARHLIQTGQMPAEPQSQ